MDLADPERTRLLKTMLAAGAQRLTRGGPDTRTNHGSGERPSSRPEAPLLRPGEVVGNRYRVVRELGEGGMGVVYSATDEKKGETVALKVVRPEFRQPADQFRVRHEFYLMATLRHPRFVEAREYTHTDDGGPCLVMEYVPGRDLHDLLPLPWEDAATVLYQVGTALAFLHSRRYIHHDIKPSNVRVQRSASTGALEARLIDFGIMEPIGGSGSRRGWVGTPAYMPPETLFGLPSDHRVDLYALGVMAFEMLTGRLPFGLGDTESFLAEKQLHPPDVRAHLGHVPPAMADLVADLMAPDASDRPYDASIVLRRLRTAANLDVDPKSTEKAPPYLSPSKLVGRDGVVTSLLTSWASKAAAPRVACIEAPPGLGRTFLLRELRLRLQMQGAVLAYGSPREAGGAFGLLRSLLHHLTALPQERLEPALRQFVPQLARLLPELGTIEGDAAADDPVEDRGKLFDALREYFAALVREHPLTLIVDDAHLADAASIDALVSLCADERLGALMVILSYVPSHGVTEGSLERLTSIGTIHRLAPFDEHAAEELLGALFGSVDPHPAFVRGLVDVSQGNPSYLVEVIRRLAAESVIRFEDERWHLPRDIGAVPLPRSLSEATRARFEALGPTARAVLEALAVVGRELSLPLLMDLLDRDEADVFAAVNELVVADLIEGRDDAYRLSATVRGERIYEQTSRARRAALHERTVRLLERHYGDRAQAHAAFLAEHCLAARDVARARHYLEIATDELYASQALVDARRPLEQLEHLLVSAGAERAPYGSREERALFQTRQRLARVGLSIDSGLAARCFLEERRAALPSLVQASSPTHVSKLGRLRRLATVLGGELGRSVLSPRRATTLAERLRQYFVATSYQTVTLALQGQFEEALAVSESLGTFVTAERSQANGAYLVSRSIVFVHQGRVPEAEQCLLTALSLFDDRELNRGIPEADLNSGYGGIFTGLTLLYTARGRPEAREWLSRFEAFVEEQDEKIRFLMPNLLLVQIDYHLHRGEVLLARQVQRRYRAHQARVGLYNANVEAQILVALARAALAARDVVAAEALVAELTRRQPKDFFTHGWGACVSGELWAAQRLHDRAHEALEEALSYATRQASPSYKLELRALNAMAALELDRGEVDRARVTARRALRIAQSPPSASEYEAMWALRTLTSVALAASEIDVAHRRAEDMEQLADRFDNPLFVALARKARSDVARALGKAEDATAHGASARKLFESIGYVPTTLSAHSKNPTDTGAAASRLPTRA